MTKVKLKRLSDIIPYIDQGYSLAHIGKYILWPRRSTPTMYRYSKKLRDAGYILNIKDNRGKKKLEV